MNEFDKVWNETMGCGACKDCISRQAVLDKKELVELEDGQFFYCINPKDVETLPSVTPQPKVGEWIITGYDYKCTNCEAEINGEINYMSKSKIKYCPYCGIKLEGEWDNNG